MSIANWLESNIDSKVKFTGNSKEAHFNCIKCSDTRQRMYVNLHSGKCYCHNCGYSGTIVNLIQSVEGYSYSKAYKVFKEQNSGINLAEIESDSLYKTLIKTQLDKPIKRAIPLPQECIPLSETSKNLEIIRAIKYLISRGITLTQIKKHKFQYCSNGPYAGRVIIPIYEQNELKFWVARAVNPKIRMKEKSPSNADYNISKSEVIFNIDKAAVKYNSIVITEGIFDALSFGDIGVSLLGKSLYTEQLRILLEYKDLLTNGIYIALDYDAKKEALKLAKKLSTFFNKIFLINIPKELDDPNNCLKSKGSRFMLDLLSSATRYSEFSEITFARLQNL